MTLKLLINVFLYICVINCVTCLKDTAFEGKTVSLNIVFRCIVLVQQHGHVLVHRVCNNRYYTHVFGSMIYP